MTNKTKCVRGGERLTLQNRHQGWMRQDQTLSKLVWSFYVARGTRGPGHLFSHYRHWWRLVATRYWLRDWQNGWMTVVANRSYLWHWWQLCLWARPWPSASSSPLGWGGLRPWSIPPVHQPQTPPLLHPLPAGSGASWRAEICCPPLMKLWTRLEKEEWVSET